MLFHEDSRGLLAVTQPAHGWVAGQLARNWGNSDFGEFSPTEDTCSGAEIHDIGMAEWELAPTLNHRTGRPYTFRELPIDQHISGWMEAPRRALTKGRYAALLTSLHGSRLFRGDYEDSDESSEAKLVREFLKRQVDFQTRMTDSLKADADKVPDTFDDMLCRNSELVFTWDRLSLRLLENRLSDQTIPDVPTSTGFTSLRLSVESREPATVRISPWPFRVDELAVHCDGRRFNDTFVDEGKMRARLANSTWESIIFRLAN